MRQIKFLLVPLVVFALLSFGAAPAHAIDLPFKDLWESVKCVTDIDCTVQAAGTAAGNFIVHNIVGQDFEDTSTADIGKMVRGEWDQGLAAAVGKVIPELNGKLDGMALRVPVVDGSCVDLVADLKKEITVEEVNAAIKAAADGELKGILEYCDEPIVSSDIIGNPASSVFDSLCTMVMGKTVKIISWYDNEWGYSNRTVDMMEKMAKL